MEGEIVRMIECKKETAPFLSMQGKRKQEDTHFHTTPPLPVSIKTPHLTRQSIEKWREEREDPKSKGVYQDTGVHEEKPGP